MPYPTVKNRSAVRSAAHGDGLAEGVRFARRERDHTVAVGDRLHAYETAPFAFAQIADGVAVTLARIPYDGAGGAFGGQGALLTLMYIASRLILD